MVIVRGEDLAMLESQNAFFSLPLTDIEIGKTLSSECTSFSIRRETINCN